MRKGVLLLALLFAPGCGSSSDDGGGGGASEACPANATGATAFECQILDLVNAERAKGGSCGGQAMPASGPLVMNATLHKTAKAHAADMAARNYFSHDTPEGKSPFDRMTAAGYDYQKAGENIAAGNATPEATMAQWMASPGHCGNILDGDFVDLGVGYAYDKSSDFGHYWVQNFGKPK